MTKQLPDPDWSLVLTLIQLQNYTTLPDLIELSLTSKHLRKKLFPHLFDLISPSKFFTSKLIKSYGDFYIPRSSLLSLIDDEFKYIKDSVNSIKLTYKASPQYNNLLTDYFKPLRSINFSGLIITGDQLNRVFDSLQTLEYIKFKSNEVLINPNSTTNQFIRLPNTIKKLKIKNNATHYTTQWEENMSFIQARRSFVGYCPSLVLEPGKNYPELTDLNFHFENSQTGLILTDLLGNNKQLETIAISGHLLTPHQFELISQCKHLTQVRLKPIYFSIDEVPLNNLDFPSVTQLTLKISKYQPTTIINYLLAPFHKSVTNLTLGYSKELQEFYNSIISEFTKVIQLKLIILGKFDTLNNLSIPKSVNFLDISNYSKINDSVNNNEAIISKLEDYHNLKRVGITYKSRSNSLLNTDCNTDYSLLDYNGCSWKVINYPLSNQFHRFL